MVDAAVLLQKTYLTLIKDLGHSSRVHAQSITTLNFKSIPLFGVGGGTIFPISPQFPTALRTVEAAVLLHLQGKLFKTLINSRS